MVVGDRCSDLNNFLPESLTDPLGLFHRILSRQFPDLFQAARIALCNVASGLLSILLRGISFRCQQLFSPTPEFLHAGSSREVEGYFSHFEDRAPVERERDFLFSSGERRRRRKKRNKDKPTQKPAAGSTMTKFPGQHSPPIHSPGKDIESFDRTIAPYFIVAA